MFDLHVHDNLIHGDNCNGINFATVDPSKGPVEAYNNVIYHVGLMDPLQLGASFSCIYVAGITNNGVEGTGTVQVFNNTLSDCAANNSANASGSRGAFGVGGGPANLIMNLRQQHCLSDRPERSILTAGWRRSPATIICGSG